MLRAGCQQREDEALAALAGLPPRALAESFVAELERTLWRAPAAAQPVRLSGTAPSA
jgi:hypothetical protein